MPPATSRLLRRLNAQRVLDALRLGGSLRVTEVIERTGLSRPTVDAVADDLIRLGWLEAVEAGGPRRGRPARSLAFRADAGYVAGVDIGEHKVRAAVADLAGEIVAEDLYELTGDALLPQVRRAASAALKAAGVRREQLLSACVGCTGPMDPETGRVIFSSVLESGFDLAGALRRTLGPRVVVENDCNLAVIGDRWHGASRGMDDVVCVLAGERMGAGIVVGGQLVRGHAGAAGEMAFLGAYEVEHGAEGVASLVRTLGGDDPEAVFAAARAGEEVALDVVERAIAGAGRAIVTLALVLNPEVVVIGGGVAGAGDVLLPPLRRGLERLARLPPRIEASPLGARIVIVGAIRRALDDLEPRLLDGLEEAA
jgi:predicted NBD/HSP70 family sugar kinase